MASRPGAVGVSRRTGVLLGLLVAALGTLLLVIGLSGRSEQEESRLETTPVVVVKEGIPRLTPVDQMSARVEIIDVPVDLVVTNAFTSLEQLAAQTGSVALVDLLPGEQLTAKRIGIRPNASGVIVPDGLVEVTVSLSSDRALGGLLAPGGTVGVLASFGTSATDGVTGFLLHSTLVSAVQFASADVVDVQANETGTSGAVVRAPLSDILVTLAVRSGEAGRIVYAAQFGELWLTSETSGSSVGNEPQVDLPRLGLVP